jgi:hypothetical protein
MITRILIALCLLATVAQGQVVRKVLRPDLGAVTNGTGMVLWMPCEETNGVRLADISGAGNSGTIAGSLQFQRKTGNYIKNTSSLTYVNLPTGKLFPGNSDFTLQVWFRTTSSAGALYSRTIYCHEANCSSSSYNPSVIDFHFFGSVYSANKTNWLGFVVRGDNNTIVILESGRPVNDGIWHHAVGTRSGNSHSLFLDGALITNAVSNTQTLSASLLAIPRFMTAGTFGNDNPDTGRTFIGDADDLRLLFRSVNLSEVKALFYSRRPTQ